MVGEVTDSFQNKSPSVRVESYQPYKYNFVVFFLNFFLFKDMNSEHLRAQYADSLEFFFLFFFFFYLRPHMLRQKRVKWKQQK